MVITGRTLPSLSGPHTISSSTRLRRGVRLAPRSGFGNGVPRLPPFSGGLTRAGVEHVFRLAKTEVGFSHFEGRSYKGLMRHMTLCQLVLLFAAEQTDRLRGEKPRRHDRADGPGAERRVPVLAPAPIQAVAG